MGHIGLYKFFFKYGHVVICQIKGNEAYNNMLNILPLHTPFTPGVGSKGHFVFSFLKEVLLHFQLSREHNASQYSALLYTHNEVN